MDAFHTSFDDQKVMDHIFWISYSQHEFSFCSRLNVGSIQNYFFALVILQTSFIFKGIFTDAFPEIINNIINFGNNQKIWKGHSSADRCFYWQYKNICTRLDVTILHAETFLSWVRSHSNLLESWIPFALSKINL